MKNLKIITTILIVTLLLAISVNTYAYNGIILFNDKIIMPENIVNGQGSITVTRDVTNYTTYYQWIEIDNSTYKEIRKLKDELLVAQYFNIYEADQTDENYDIYVSSYEYYKSLYGSTVDNYTEERIDEVESIIVSLWPNYTDNWTQSSNNLAKIDLNSFSGTKDFVLWVKVATSNNAYYFADTYEITGTKTSNNNDNTNNDDNNNQDDDNNNNNDNNQDDDNNNNNDNNNNQDDDNNNNNDNNQDDDNNNNNDNNQDDNNNNNNNNNQDDDNNNNNDNNQDDNNNNNNNDNQDNNNNNHNNDNNNNNNQNGNNNHNNNGKNDKTSNTKAPIDSTTAKSKIPQTGQSYIILSLIAIFSTISVFSYIKYKKQ